MRKKFGWWWVFAIALVPAVAPAARACQMCTSEMWCTETQNGGAVCLGTGDWCTMAGKCRNGRGSIIGEYAMIQLSLLEDVPGAAGEPGAAGDAARVQRNAGPLAVGRHAQRSARAARAWRGADAPVLFSGVGVWEGGAAVIRSPRGDGFVLSRVSEGRTARVRVRELQGDRPGRALAEERLGDQDALVVRVTLDGQPRVLVLQTALLSAAEGRERELSCRRAIGETPSARLPGEPPPFELRALDE